MFKQEAFSAASSNNRECFSSCDLKIDAAQNFLLPNPFGQRSDCDHRRRSTRGKMRFSGGLWRWRRFDHRNAQLSTLNPQLSTPNAFGLSCHTALLVSRGINDVEQHRQAET